MEDPLCIPAQHQVYLIRLQTELGACLLYGFDSTFGITHPMGVVGPHHQMIRAHPLQTALHSRTVKRCGIRVNPFLIGDVGRLFKLDTPFLAITLIGILYPADEVGDRAAQVAMNKGQVRILRKHPLEDWTATHPVYKSWRGFVWLDRGGVYALANPLPEFLTEGKKFIQDYKTKFKVNPGPYSALSYDAMNLLADAVKRAGSTDKKAVAAALKATKEFKGISGPVSFTDNRPAAAGGRSTGGARDHRWRGRLERRSPVSHGALERGALGGRPAAGERLLSTLGGSVTARIIGESTVDPLPLDVDWIECSEIPHQKGRMRVRLERGKEPVVEVS